MMLLSALSGIGGNDGVYDLFDGTKVRSRKTTDFSIEAPGKPTPRSESVKAHHKEVRRKKRRRKKKRGY